MAVALACNRDAGLQARALRRLRSPPRGGLSPVARATCRPVTPRLEPASPAEVETSIVHVYRPSMSRGPAGIALLLPSLLGCEPRAASSDPVAHSGGSPSGAAGVANPSASPTISHMVLRPVSAGFGGVGPYMPPPQPDLWVVLFVDLEAAAPLSGVEVTEVELLDAEGKVIARGKPPWSLRRDTTTDATARRQDFAEHGSVPYDGTVQPGTPLRLRVRALLDTRTEALPKPGPVRYRARLRAADDPGMSVEGPVHGPWATG